MVGREPLPTDVLEPTVMYVLLSLLVIPVVLWIGYNFMIGSIKGWREGMDQMRWRKLKYVWRLCQIANRRQNVLDFPD